jgi:uncharacterized protein (TIGR00251 family)
MNLKETEDGVIVEVFVKPNAKSFKITVSADEIVVFCTEQPVKGKANKELVKEFSKFFHAKVKLVSGATSKQKRLLITGVTKSEVEQLLCFSSFTNKPI